jgi:hypothetical protein
LLKKKHIYDDRMLEWQTEVPRFFCPPGMDDVCNDVAGKTIFTPAGCMETSCFPFTDTGDPLTVFNRSQTSNPWCFDKFKNANNQNPGPDTMYHEFIDGQCVLQNPFIRAYAQFPSLRALEPTEGLTDTSPFRYQPAPTPTSPPWVFLTQQYCERDMRIEWDAGNFCYMKWYQHLATYFMGNLWREL